MCSKNNPFDDLSVQIVWTPKGFVLNKFALRLFQTCWRVQSNLQIFNVHVLHLHNAIIMQCTRDDTIYISWVFKHCFCNFFFKIIIPNKKNSLTDFIFPLKWKGDWNMIEVATMAIFIFWAFEFDFVVSELGQWVTNQFIEFSDEVCACSWYALPLKMQQMYLIFLMDTEQPMHIHSYGDIACSRETFKQVLFLFDWELI